MNKDRKLAIIGVGPRGLYAIEQAINELSKLNVCKNIQFLLFEQTGHFGNGQVYDTDQIHTNWINISERALTIENRLQVEFGNIKLPPFPSYHDWIDKNYLNNNEEQKDTYPARSKIGTYLQERFETFVMPLVKNGLVQLCAEKVKDFTIQKGKKATILTESSTYDQIDEVLLTIGHQPTKISKQLKKWEEYSEAQNEIALIKTPYPISDYLDDHKIDQKSTIGIRGLGLAMIDVARALATKFGNFESTDSSTLKNNYYLSKNQKFKLVPFSLDGLPPVPKPLNAKIDNLYKPGDDEISNFEYKIGNLKAQKRAKSPQFLIDAFKPIASKIFSQLTHSLILPDTTLKEIEQVTEKWLKNEKYEHHLLLSHQNSAQNLLSDFVEMAVGTGDVSLDFCLGQVWRHLQPSIYRKLSHNECCPEVFAEIIELDERMKRYAYGPPVESIQQILALLKAQIMSFNFVNDPKIELTTKGWKFKSKDSQIVVDMVINSILDAPQIKYVSSPLVDSLLKNNILEVVHDDFGVATDKNGYLISDNKDHDLPIALLGRLAKGSIIGVDAILECFGDRPTDWAATFAKKHKMAIE